MILVALEGVIKQYLVEKFVERQLRVREASGGSNFFGWKWQWYLNIGVGRHLNIS